MPLRFLLIFSSLLLGSHLDAQPHSWFSHQTESGEVESLAAFMERSHVHGLSICVMTGLKTDTLINLGLRNAETAAPVDSETKFLVGGMAGALTQFLVLRAATLGMLDLDRPVNGYLKRWRIPENRFTKRLPVTTRDLLLHLRKFNLGYKPAGQAPGAPVASSLQLVRGEAPATNAPVRVVGKQNKSGNGQYANFLVLQLLIEELWSGPFEEVVQAEVLEPLGMKNSVWKARLDAADYENCASGYSDEGVPQPGMHLQYSELGHSGLWTTAEDYARFAAHVFAAAEGQKGSLISQDLARKSIAPQEGYRSYIFHQAEFDLYWGGASKGFYTTFAGKPANGTVITIFTNSNLNWRFTNAVSGMAWEFARSKSN